MRYDALDIDAGCKVVNLYVVDALPIESEDVTLRMARVLRQAAFAASGDAAALRQRLEALGVRTPVVKVAGDLPHQTKVLLDALQRGEGVWVCGLGAPWGGDDWQVVRALSRRGVDLEAVPGPSAAIGALAASGLPSARVTFLGTLPLGSEGRRAVLREIGSEAGTLVCRVPAGALSDMLSEIDQELGGRRVAIAWQGETLRITTEGGPEGETGPCELVIEGGDQSAAWSEQLVRERAVALLGAGRTARDVTQEIAGASGWPRREVYALVIRLGEEQSR